jgi:hypothetical protein
LLGQAAEAAGVKARKPRLKAALPSGGVKYTVTMSERRAAGLRRSTAADQPVARESCRQLESIRVIEVTYTAKTKPKPVFALFMGYIVVIEAQCRRFVPPQSAIAHDRGRWMRKTAAPLLCQLMVGQASGWVS